MNTHEAGRELDALVADRVMCLTVGPVQVIGLGGRIHRDVGIVGPVYMMPDGREGVRAESLPYYSTDIRAAWQVVEKLEREPNGFAMTLESDGTTRWWGVRFWQADTFYDGEAETAPHAICLAALKAVGVRGD